MKSRISAKSNFSRPGLVLFFGALAGLAWASLGCLLFFFNVGDYDFWHPGRLLAYVLLVAAPSFTFIPIGKALNMGVYGYWATLSWSALLYIIAFVPTRPELGWRENLPLVALLLATLFLVTVSLALPLFYRLGFTVFTRRVEKYDRGRAWREAFLAGLCVVLLAMLSLVNTLSLLSALALIMVFIVLELLVLTRNFGRN